MMIAAFNDNNAALRDLTDLLLAVCPGGIIYKLTNEADLRSCLLDHRPDAVFMKLHERNANLLIQLRSLNTTVPIIAYADDDSLLEEAMWNGANAYLVEPLLSEQIVKALNKQEGAFVPD